MPRMYAGRRRAAAEDVRATFTRPDPRRAWICACRIRTAMPGGSTGSRCSRGALPHVDVFAPSIDELLFMLDRRVARAAAAGRRARAGRRPRASLSRLSRRLFEMGATVVAIKLGEQGLYLRTTADADRVGRFCDRVGSTRTRGVSASFSRRASGRGSSPGTTGSGDATIAGLLAATPARGRPDRGRERRHGRRRL